MNVQRAEAGWEGIEAGRWLEKNKCLGKGRSPTGYGEGKCLLNIGFQVPMNT
jgi:hypothetical protein